MLEKILDTYNFTHIYLENHLDSYNSTHSIKLQYFSHTNIYTYNVTFRSRHTYNIRHRIKHTKIHAHKCTHTIRHLNLDTHTHRDTRNYTHTFTHKKVTNKMRYTIKHSFRDIQLSTQKNTQSDRKIDTKYGGTKIDI